MHAAALISRSQFDFLTPEYPHSLYTRWDTPISVDLPVTSFQIRVVENCRGIFGSEIQHAVFSTNLLCAAKMILDVSDTILAAVEVKHPGQGQLFDLAAGATIPLDCVASQHLLPPCCTSNCSKQQPASNYNRPLHSCSTINGATRGPQPVGQAPHAASAFRSILSQVPIMMGMPLCLC